MIDSFTYIHYHHFVSHLLRFCETNLKDFSIKILFYLLLGVFSSLESSLQLLQVRTGEDNAEVNQSWRKEMGDVGIDDQSSSFFLFRDFHLIFHKLLKYLQVNVITSLLSDVTCGDLFEMLM